MIKFDEAKIDSSNHLHQLLNSPSVHEGAHILYTFNEQRKYLENVMTFIVDGLAKREVVLIIDLPEHIQLIKNNLLQMNVEEIEIQSIIFVNSSNIYIRKHTFDRLSKILDPLLSTGLKVRIWGHILFTKTNSNVTNLKDHESLLDLFVSYHNLICVSTYNGGAFPASVQNELLKVHSFMMTDKEIAPSPFYRKDYLHMVTKSEEKRVNRLEIENSLLKKKNNNFVIDNKRMKVKKELIQQNEKFYRTLITELPIGVFISKKGKIKFMNEAGRKLLHSMDQLNEIEKQLSPYLTKIDEGKPKSYVKELNLTKPNGNTLTLQIKSIPTWFEKGDATLHTITDLTDQKISEQLLVQSEKLNMAGELAAGIAHEVRNPLTSIKGFFNLIKHEQNKDSYFDIIEDEIDRIEQVSSELLMLSRPYIENLSVCSIHQIIEDVKKWLAQQASQKNIDIVIKSTEKELFISCEEIKIKQVFINLVKNAIEVMESGKILIEVKKVNKDIKINIIDEGPGFSKEMLTRIGEPFYSTKEKGTGLGLMVCYKIIKNHQGSINVQSHEGKGTTFTISLPSMY
ncbi:two-component system sporulation sensor kinase A [Bacillus mesophilus]|uniref:histidine kinase n=1 Tax=Bacillus mesophilus TaxID=1808955 RepID=A0A6M0Q4J9_9BACI|nr:ATP-binding protein [Bacillus mesophilus]MBM7661327.1 two-component system sporulation sensor kinase A [Bacillus mesophilus]NEY71154.1 two-component sensor histidine kinase [Bacillus mesophilus]